VISGSGHEGSVERVAQFAQEPTLAGPGGQDQLFE